MKPLVHARSSAHHFGGRWSDYLAIHNLIDSSKAALATNHHRALFHNDWGREVAVASFGKTIETADGTTASVADVFDRHCLEDLGFVPSVEEWTDRNLRPPSFLARRPCPPDLETIREDAAGGLAARYRADPALFAPALAIWDHGASRSNGRWGLVAALTLNSATIVTAEAILGPTITSDRGRMIPTREVGELLALSRWAHVPSLQEVVGGIRIEPWMMGSRGAGCAVCASS